MKLGVGCALLLTNLAKAQVPTQQPVPGIEQRVYTYVERMPQLLTGGGTRAVEEAIKKRLAIARKDSKECKGSKLQVQFTVDATGAVKDEHIERGLTAACDAAVLAAVRKLPAFIPGVQNGRKVAVRLTVPVLF
ncbi:hypothetical protein GCM10027594_33970 [Hymenobacter agri]